MLESESSYKTTATINVFMILAGTMALLFGRGVGVFYGNQVQYFLLPMRLAFRDFLPGDWFVWDTMHYHVVFGYTIAPFFRILGIPATTIAGQVLTLIVITAALLFMIKKLTCRPLGVFWYVIVWYALTWDSEAGLTHFGFPRPAFEPSQVAVSLIFAGFVLLLYDRPLGAGLSLGISSIFHFGIAVAYGFPILVVALWYLRKHGLMQCRSLLFSLFSGWIVTIAIAAVFWRNAGAGSSTIQEIILTIRSPHHYQIKSIDKELTFIWLGWIVLSLPALYQLHKGSGIVFLRILHMTLVLVVFLSIVAAWTKISMTLTLLSPWRCSPFLTLIAHIMIGIMWINLNQERSKRMIGKLLWIGVFATTVAFWHSWPWYAEPLQIIGSGMVVTVAALALIIHHKPTQVFMLLATICGFGIYVYLFDFHAITFLRLIWATLLPVTLVLQDLSGNNRKTSYLTRGMVIAGWAAFLICASLIGNKMRSHLNHRPTGARAEIIDVVQKNTAPDSTFVVPPTLDWWRVIARRPIVVDWKACAYSPAAQEEWYRRHLDQSGVDWGANLNNVIAGYREIDTARAHLLAEEYGADYLVTETQEHKGDLSGLEVLYRGADLTLWKISWPAEALPEQ